MTYKAAAGSGSYRPNIKHRRLYQCETCKHIDKTSYRHYYCTLAKEELDGDELAFLTRVGCSSHSDHQNQMEKVLDELKEKTTLKKVYHVYDDHLRGLTFYVKLDDIYKVIEELRQEGKQEVMTE